MIKVDDTMKKSLFIVGGLAVLLVVVGYVFSQNKQNIEENPVVREEIVQEDFLEKTEDWNMYSNGEHFYSFRYPPQHVLVDDNPDKIYLRQPGAGDHYLIVTVVEGQSFDDALAGYEIFSYGNRKIDSSENVEINGKQWRKVIVDGHQVLYLTHVNARTYIFHTANFNSASDAPVVISTVDIVE